MRRTLFMTVLSLTLVVHQGIAAPSCTEGLSADRVLVEKTKRQLTLLADGQVLKRYRIALGGNPVGAKERLGDQKTPEGLYIIAARKADSQFHLALRISYPGPEDLERATQLGVHPGGNIMIHGLRNGLDDMAELHSLFDWTLGCIAVTNREIEEIWRLVPDGTPIEIRP